MTDYFFSVLYFPSVSIILQKLFVIHYIKSVYKKLNEVNHYSVMYKNPSRGVNTFHLSFTLIKSNEMRKQVMNTNIINKNAGLVLKSEYWLCVNVRFLMDSLHERWTTSWYTAARHEIKYQGKGLDSFYKFNISIYRDIYQQLDFIEMWVRPFWHTVQISNVSTEVAKVFNSPTPSLTNPPPNHPCPPSDT